MDGWTGSQLRERVGPVSDPRYCVLQLPGKKDLFIEADLMSPLDRIANVSILKVPAPLPSGLWPLFPHQAVLLLMSSTNYQRVTTLLVNAE